MITTMTPASENIRGTSALPYHLIGGNLTPNPSPKGEGNCQDDGNNKFIIYTFNNNGLSDEKIEEVEKELNSKIHKVPLPRWFRLVFKFRLLFVRLFLKYPIHHYVKLPQQYVDEIKAKKPDIIWVYGAEWSKVVSQFDGFKRIHTLPDSEALYYYRMLGQRFVTHNWKTFWRCCFMYPKFLALERHYSTDPSIHYHLVGEEDANFLRRMNPGIQAHFIRHPHYEISKEISYENENSLTPNPSPRGEGNLNNRISCDNENSKLKTQNFELKRFHSPKIKVLIAGQYNYYMKQDADELLEELKNSRIEELKEHYVFTFLGKGWEKHVEDMKEAGYEVEHITFAPDYIEEIVKHDIQITPISIGTGTKGKVLDALANGLLVIGTHYAMENIAVENGVSCIEYHEPQEVIDVLMDIPSNMDKYEQMAIKGREAILTIHGRETVSKQLFSMFQDTRITKYSKL